jgi:hypothetical protein
MSDKWFVRRGEKVFGPVDSAKIKSLATTGQINESTQVAQQASGPWVNAGTIRGLFTATPPASTSPGSAAVPPPPMPPPPTTTAATAAKPKPWFRRWYAMFLLYPFLLFCGCGLVIPLVVPKETLERWDAEAAERRAERVKQDKKADTERDAVAIARKRGEDAGHQAGFLWAKLGKRMPDNNALHATAAVEAAEKIPSNTALIGSGSDEERLAYARGWVAQFSVGYKKAN